MCERHYLTRRVNFILVFLFYFSSSYSQNLEFKLQKNRYNSVNISSMNKGHYDFIGHAYIDPRGQNSIDYDLLKSKVLKQYPVGNETDFLILDIENQVFRDLKSKNYRKRQSASNKLIAMIKLVKKLRPNLKVSLYGVPFRFNYQFQKKQHFDDVILPLMKEMDFLSPDLYFSNSCDEQNTSSYLANLKENLGLFVSYSKKANKPLYPFIWYKVDPYNKRSGNSTICKERMDLLLTTLNSFSNDNNVIKGVLWWENWYKGIEKDRAKLTDNVLKFTK